MATTTTAANTPKSGSILGNGLKIVGERVAPGASLILDGKVVPGILHLVAATLARAVLGPVGVLLVAANSYSTSVTGKNLLTQAKAVAD